MTVKKEDILTWLISFGHEWVGIDQLHEVYKADQDPHGRMFWDRLQYLHDAMFITKRTKRQKVDSSYILVSAPKGFKYPTHIQIEQYRLTPRALYELGRDDD